ncbi:YbaB/EbfC family nucleoid-associated protein [Methylocystis bryophila]|uniref:Nucleoid-associated protein B1812_00920 n=1 Tax=Methylocystis bryophila TaxID=655015 RepID=A0A1W6MQV8_9HYPH|nr:YbaB/EbfC family nucleoid-associated protein [Methylocystis bryophila]ARN79869.1 YbaB/EbfC family nucleoid-associated protein [Methylocystis bryophila]BDV39758.1 nucleoid-associated protein [Methylocystis bryophila]
MDFMGMIKQAQAMQAKMQEAQAELETTFVEGEAGGGVVKVTLTAKGALQKVSIDKGLLKPEEGEILEDLIVSAHAQARAKAEAAMTEKMKAITGGLQLPPGMKLPF